MANYTVKIKGFYANQGNQFGTLREDALPDWDGVDYQAVINNAATTMNDGGKPKYEGEVLVDVYYQSAYYSNIRILTLTIADYGTTVGYVNRARYVTDTAGATGINYSDIHAEIKAIGDAFLACDLTALATPYPQFDPSSVGGSAEEDWQSEINQTQTNPTTQSPTFEDFAAEADTLQSNPSNVNNNMTDTGFFD